MAESKEDTQDPNKCVHCGNARPEGELRDDWPCRNCDKFQSSAVCPNCGSVVSASLLKKK